MVFCIEKRQPVPGVGGANFEETVVVTADGYELLTSAHRDHERTEPSGDSCSIG
jgi:Xaa-Pro aminopeptidase